MNRGAAVAAVLVIALLSSAFGGIALAADSASAAPSVQANSTATPAPTDTETATEQASNWTPPGPFKLNELKRGGIHDSEAPPSARMLDGPGMTAVRSQPPSPLEDEKKLLKPNSRVESDTIELWSTWFGEEAAEYQLVLVYWQSRTKTVDGTDVTYAADQQVQRVSVSFDNGYSTTPIRLQSHYNEPVQVTMWLENNGDRVQGARWRFEHRSNPLTAAPGFEINSKGDLWRWGATFIMLPAIAGLFVSRRTAQHLIDRTVTSPRKGTGWWAFMLGILVLVLVSLATWQTAAVLARAPAVSGVFMFFASLIVMLGLRDNDLETAEFNKKDLKSVTALHDDDDDRKQARSEDIRLHKIVRRGGEIFLPAKGIRPFLARYWADPASVDESELKTVNRTEGDVSLKYEIDPEAEDTLVHKPARLALDPTLIEESEGERPAGTMATIEDFLGRVNTQFLMVALGGGAAVYYGVMYAIDVQSIAGMLALLPALVAATKAKNGHLSMEPAPYHFANARANLVSERADYKEARTFEDLHQLVAELDLEVIEQTQETTEAVRDELRDRLNSMFGVSAPGPRASDDDFSSSEQGVSDD